MLQRVDERVRSTLNRDVPNWRLLNACPPCFYCLQDELSLTFSLLCEMDGNNSLKRTDTLFRDQIARHDQHSVRSDYWVTPEQVDAYQNEVKANSVSDQAE